MLLMCTGNLKVLSGVYVCVYIGVLRHMQQYFSYRCDDTDVQADWRRSFTYGQDPIAIDIL